MVDTVTHIDSNDFESQYIQLRYWEGRVFEDDDVRKLPVVDTRHQHFHEWKVRRESARKLYDFLSRKDHHLDILEVGCGNGWLSAFLSKIPGSDVMGIDINKTELSQAARVFNGHLNLQFRFANMEEILGCHLRFDSIVFAASIQYFPSLFETVSLAKNLLKPGGELHIIDSHFYRTTEVQSARQRSALYFEEMGFSSLEKYYFHHCLDDLKSFDTDIMYDPQSLFTRFLRYKNPFHWIRISK